MTNNTDEEENYTLLIVDDDKTNLKVLTHILGQDYTIFTAVNGKNAIEKAKELMPDLILMDILMPEMDGYQSLAEIKKCEEIKDIPVIFITGLNRLEDEERGLDLDAADFIHKPFSARIVQLRVRNQIQIMKQIRDIEKYAKVAEAANRSKSVFLAKMSHEIRTPLNAVLGISEIQLQNEKLPQNVKEAFIKILTSGDLLLGIINDILDISKIEAGKLELMPAKYDVAAMINDTILLNIITYEKKPIEFILKIDENVPSHLFGDEIRIKQILNNLLSNAFKYTNSGTVELSVAAEISGEDSGNNVTLVFRVCDTGQGMTKEQIEKLFDEYSRFNLQENRMTEGVGLGMSITRNLIYMMNGNIYAESETGNGSVFTVQLPQGNTGAPGLGKETVEKMRMFRANYEAKLNSAQIIRSLIRSGRVLIVDDVEINLFVAEEMLSFYGLQVDKASGGLEAIEKVKNCNYDLVFMDHIMPIMDGIEATAQIRKLGADYEKLPIIALTANAVSGVKEMFLANGFNGFLSKPIGMRELDGTLKKWMPSG